MQPSELVRRVADENPERQKSQGRRIDPGVIPLDKGDPDFATPPHICEAAYQAMLQGFTKYTPNSGLLSLREAIAVPRRVDPGGDLVRTAMAVSTSFGN